MSRLIDKSKKSNIKCEHCEWWCPYSFGEGIDDYCMNIHSERFENKTNYWNRCKQFEWDSELTYKENSNGADN